jgi:hypothetical protein
LHKQGILFLFAVAGAKLNIKEERESKKTMAAKEI